MWIRFALLLLAFGPPAAAAAGVSCHCFRDRSFDPADPSAADPYVLATTQNSFLAAALGTEKKAIVRAKMTGTAGEDLWIAHGLGAQLDLPAEHLLDARDRTSSWGLALAALNIPPERFGGPVETVLAGRGGDGDLAGAVVDRLLIRRLGPSPGALRTLREAGAADAQTVAAVVAWRLTGRDPGDLFRRISAGKSTWGAVFREAGVEPQEIEDRIRRLLDEPVPIPESSSGG